MRGTAARGRQVRLFRQSIGWTQEQLAATADCAVRTVRNVERGNRVDAATLASIATALDVQLGSIATNEHVREPQIERHKRLVLHWESAYIAGAIDRILEFHQPDTWLEMSGPEGLAVGGTFRGIDQLRGHLEIVFQQLRVAEVHERRIHAVDNIVFFRPLATMLAVPTGKFFTVRLFNEIEFRDEKICRRMTLSNWGKYCENVA